MVRIGSVGQLKGVLSVERKVDAQLYKIATSIIEQFLPMLKYNKVTEKFLYASTSWCIHSHFNYFFDCNKQ